MGDSLKLSCFDRSNFYTLIHCLTHDNDVKNQWWQFTPQNWFLQMGMSHRPIYITHPAITNTNANVQPSTSGSTVIPTTSITNRMAAEAGQSHYSFVLYATHITMSYSIVCKLSKRRPSFMSGISCHSCTGTEKRWRGAKGAMYRLIIYIHQIWIGIDERMYSEVLFGSFWVSGFLTLRLCVKAFSIMSALFLLFSC